MLFNKLYKFKEYEFKEKLVFAREFLEENVEGFPYKKCHLTAEFLKRTLNLDVVVGVYVPDDIRISKNFSEYIPDLALCQGHAWNYSSLWKKNYDLTYDQFTKKKEDKIKILKIKDKSLMRLNDGWMYHFMHLNDSVFRDMLEDLTKKFEKIKK